MHKQELARTHPLCPSSLPEQDGSLVIGVVNGSVEDPQVIYLSDPQPVSRDLLEHIPPGLSTEVLRCAAPCVEQACKHFDGSQCRLATRVVRILPQVVDTLPACRIRSRCRWWQQEGRLACLRCPQVVTDTSSPSPLLRQAALPE